MKQGFGWCFHYGTPLDSDVCIIASAHELIN